MEITNSAFRTREDGYGPQNGNGCRICRRPGAAEKFWTEKLGFEVSKKLPMGPKAYWIELGPKGAESYITLFPKFMMPDWNERKPSLVFETDDIQKTYEELKAKGVDIDPPKEMGFGIFTQFRDIDGNEFGLRQHK